ncbi:MAG TPA: hypothetical protein VKQ52_12600, partial [Puia sp.]|nr:hypothetical protein [Puia sp.]
MIKRLLHCAAGILLATTIASAQQSPVADTGQRSLPRLYLLLQSSHEADWLTAANSFYQLKRQLTVDSLQKAERIRFPHGVLVRMDSLQTVYHAKSAKEKEAAFKRWIRQFPQEKTDPDVSYDYARHNVGREYALEDNVPKAMQYAGMFVSRPWKGEGAAGIAYVLADKGHYKEAGILLQRAIDNAVAFMTFRRNENGAAFAATGYVSYCTKYAEILYHEKQYDSALKYVAIAHDSAKKV